VLTRLVSSGVLLSLPMSVLLDEVWRGFNVGQAG
jgi:hypothetical protein